jgi:rRNA maturation RNase YbeY
MARAIHFFSEDTRFEPKDKRALRHWLQNVVRAEKQELETLNFIFCSDQYLLTINRQYLDHDTYTDIITFDNSEGDTINGDVFISIDRVNENAATLNLAKRDELHRVMVHGVLHLLGYTDKGKAKKQEMTAKEDHYLKLRGF